MHTEAVYGARGLMVLPRRQFVSVHVRKTLAFELERRRFLDNLPKVRKSRTSNTVNKSKRTRYARANKNCMGGRANIVCNKTT